MLSFIVPAHNEEMLLGRTLSALHESARAVREPYEVVVVDDASTDRTSEIALEHGARVISVNHRQIAATRNAGAVAATGDVLIFVDADTSVTGSALRAAMDALQRGAVGGGAIVHFDEGRLPLYARVLEFVLPPVLRILQLAPGCFVFCTRNAYLAAGGFDEALYVTEEVGFAHRLKHQGRFVILPEFVITSARKLRARSALQLLLVGLRLAIGGEKSLRTRDGLEYWYGSRDTKETCTASCLEPRVMFRFTIRDLLWLTVIVAVAVTWQIEHRRDALRAEHDRVATLMLQQSMQDERREGLLREREMKVQLDALQESNAAFELQLRGFAQQSKPQR